MQSSLSVDALRPLRLLGSPTTYEELKVTSMPARAERQRPTSATELRLTRMPSHLMTSKSMCGAVRASWFRSAAEQHDSGRNQWWERSKSESIAKNLERVAWEVTKCLERDMPSRRPCQWRKYDQVPRQEHLNQRTDDDARFSRTNSLSTKSQRVPDVSHSRRGKDREVSIQTNESFCLPQIPLDAVGQVFQVCGGIEDILDHAESVYVESLVARTSPGENDFENHHCYQRAGEDQRFDEGRLVDEELMATEKVLLEEQRSREKRMEAEEKRTATEIVGIEDQRFDEGRLVDEELMATEKVLLEEQRSREKRMEAKKNEQRRAQPRNSWNRGEDDDRRTEEARRTPCCREIFCGGAEIQRRTNQCRRKTNSEKMMTEERRKLEERLAAGRSSAEEQRSKEEQINAEECIAAEKGKAETRALKEERTKAEEDRRALEKATAEEKNLHEERMMPEAECLVVEAAIDQRLKKQEKSEQVKAEEKSLDAESLAKGLNYTVNSSSTRSFGETSPFVQGSSMEDSLETCQYSFTLDACRNLGPQLEHVAHEYHYSDFEDLEATNTSKQQEELCGRSMTTLDEEGLGSLAFSAELQESRILGQGQFETVQQAELSGIKASDRVEDSVPAQVDRLDPLERSTESFCSVNTFSQGGDDAMVCRSVAQEAVLAFSLQSRRSPEVCSPSCGSTDSFRHYESGSSSPSRRTARRALELAVGVNSHRCSSRSTKSLGGSCFNDPSEIALVDSSLPHESVDPRQDDLAGLREVAQEFWLLFAQSSSADEARGNRMQTRDDGTLEHCEDAVIPEEPHDLEATRTRLREAIFGAFTEETPEQVLADAL